ncbi:VOC family protein [Herbiconiux liangxiaofengii]|uniref:VOC family protein n=1 Tax=Herbiconiux liangxiaofengii TaxID=3342795 RepID=UPI0035B960F1
MTTLNPYLSFRGQAKEAIEFYHSVFGGDLRMNTFSDFGMPVAPGEEGQIMHAQLTSPNGLVLMAADTPQQMELTVGDNITVSLSGTDSGELHGYFDALAAGGRIDEPLVPAPWGDSFGMLTDRFGIHWMVNIGSSPE